MPNQTVALLANCQTRYPVLAWKGFIKAIGEVKGMNQSPCGRKGIVSMLESWEELCGVGQSFNI